MDKKYEYIKFMCLLTIKYNIEINNFYINSMKKTHENFKNQDKYDSDFKNRLENELKKIQLTKDNAICLFGTDDIEKINYIIHEMWQSVLKSLLNKDIDYETTMKSLDIDDIQDNEYMKYYDIEYDERMNRKRILYSYDTPIYIDIKHLISMGDLSLLDIYSQLIKNSLFNPNMNKSGNSDEFFWTKLPDADKLNSDELFELNKLVICDPRTDYHLLGNGSDILEYFLRSACVDYWQTKSERQIKNNIDIIDYAIRFNRCSILDSYRSSGNYIINCKPLIFTLFNGNYVECVSDKMSELKRYLLTEKGIKGQIDSSIYFADRRNEAIEYYIEVIKNSKNFENNNLILKLENLIK